MRETPRRLQIPPSNEVLPAPISFRTRSVPPDSIYPKHRHAGGEFVYSFTGVIEVQVAGHHYLAPPQYGLWLPPNIEHVGLARYEACHFSLYIAPERCAALPLKPCALTVTPLVRAILEHLRQHPQASPPTDEDERLLQVLVDQLARASCAGSYLPTSEDALLGPVLRMLEANPGDNRSLPELARASNTTERTLTRRCQRDLGMSFVEWRQRLRVVKAMPLLETGRTVEAIAFDLGYSSASAFIAMFRRLMGVTPDEFRKGAAVLPRPAVSHSDRG